MPEALSALYRLRRRTYSSLPDAQGMMKEEQPEEVSACLLLRDASRSLRDSGEQAGESSFGGAPSLQSATVAHPLCGLDLRSGMPYIRCDTWHRIMVTWCPGTKTRKARRHLNGRCICRLWLEGIGEVELTVMCITDTLFVRLKITPRRSLLSNTLFIFYM